jgi:hypothetical protein
MLVALLVNAAGLAAQLPFDWPTAFVTPFTVIVQLAVPAAIVNVVTLNWLLLANVVAPEQPAPLMVAAAPAVKRKPLGKVSVKVMPVCCGGFASL